MNTTKFIELLSYTLPAIITGLVAYFFFKQHTKNEDNRRIFLLRKENQHAALPLRLQAYERMTLFLERIAPHNIIVRITPNSDDKVAYQKKLVATIEQEFEHNLSQQIYITDRCWNVIVTAKNTTISTIRTTMANTEVKDADAMREAILKKSSEKESPSKIALAYIKNEVGKIF